MALGVLEKGSLITREPNPAGRGKVVALTGRGRGVRRDSLALIEAIEAGWPDRFGTDVVAGLRTALEAVAGDERRLTAGMAPYPDGWRAAVPPPTTLPQFPTVLHRGGYPDGS